MLFAKWRPFCPEGDELTWKMVPFDYIIMENQPNHWGYPAESTFPKAYLASKLCTNHSVVSQLIPQSTVSCPEWPLYHKVTDPQGKCHDQPHLHGEWMQWNGAKQEKPPKGYTKKTYMIMKSIAFLWTAVYMLIKYHAQWYLQPVFCKFLKWDLTNVIKEIIENDTNIWVVQCKTAALVH